MEVELSECFPVVIWLDYILVSFAVAADEFRYTCMSGEVSIEGVDDRKDMEETQQTFSRLGNNHRGRQTPAIVFKPSRYLNLHFSISPYLHSRAEGRLSVRCVQSAGGHLAPGKRGNQRLWW